MYGSGVSAGGGGGGGGVSLRATGWGNYRDTQYSDQVPYLLVADTKTALPNNAGIKDESQLPEDMITFYNPATQEIQATNGSDYIITANIKVRPTTIDATAVILQIETTQNGTPVVVASDHKTLPWGIGVVSVMNFTFSGYAREAFSNNGARLFIQSDGPIQVFDISYIIKRTHRGL